MRLAQRFAALPVRHKLLALVLLPLAVVLPSVGLGLLLWTDEAVDRLLITKIRSDLAIANGYFERVLGEVRSGTEAIAESHALHRALGDGAPAAGRAELPALLRAFRQRAQLDFVALRGADGRVLVTDSGPVAAVGADDAASTFTVPGASRTSVEVVPAAQVVLLAPALAGRVAVPLVPTRNAAPTERTREERAMLLVSTQPVRDAAGRLVAHVQGGVLLNRNLPFIDHINEIVYPEGALPFGSRGTATLFLDDVRISTNVRLFGEAGEERAIGTRVSQAVRETVLGSGRTWLDRAFVVNDWYVSAYQPLADGAGRRVGMLYVGYTEAPFRWLKYGALLAVGALIIAVMVAAALLSLKLARTVFAPVERMARTMQRVGAGERTARVGATGSADEIGQLAAHLDRLLDTIAENTAALERWNAELDAKVAERTRDLQAAQGQLVRSEKLAAVGQLTASIAHEVNNPIAVIQGNLDLLRELLGPDTARVAGELKLVDEQIERMRLIVTKLLQFARPSEYAGYVEPVDCNQVLDDCLVLAGHQLARKDIVVRKDCRARGRPPINRNELQQVFVNLIVNAIHAMPGGGELLLRTRDAGDGADAAVEVAVADTGVGLPEELLPTLFQPFVTRKAEGTGLGLWISRSLVERYGGDVRAANRGDGTRGAVFTVVLKVQASEAVA
jgi:signal transduction histidine kinase